jgi:pimeloyl-ACP methyl ester carboxylesterase
MRESSQRRCRRSFRGLLGPFLIAVALGCAEEASDAGMPSSVGPGVSMNGVMGVAGSGVGIGMPPGFVGSAGAPQLNGSAGARPVAGTSGAAIAGRGAAGDFGGAAGSVAVQAGSMANAAGIGGGAGVAGAGGMAGSAMPAPMDSGDCCPDGNCLCHGPAPTALTSAKGPFATKSYELPNGTVYYPTDAEPPFAAIAICPGFLNVGPEMAPWGPFYASHGIVLMTVYTGAADVPAIRALLLLDGIDALKAENTKSGSPLMGKLSGRYGTSGYSMGGGGTTIASGSLPELKTSVGLAAWAPEGAGVKVPTLLLCGEADTVAACSQSSSAYRAIPESTPKMMVTIPGVSHLSWFGPTDAGRGTSGAMALAFEKVFLEGDERWRPLLVKGPTGGTMTTNIE